MRRICLILLAILPVASYASASTFTFDSGFEGWYLVDANAQVAEGVLSWVATGGNPDGHAEFYDLGFDGSFLAAPVCALGDWSIHDGTGVITYDHKVIDVGMLNQIVPYEARMDGPGGAAIWRGGTPPGAIGWVPVTVPLTEADWEMQSGTWSGLLASVTAFRIRIEQIDGDNDRDGLDNIVLPPPAPAPASTFTFHLGLEGWYLVDANAQVAEGVLSWVATGGNPDGHAEFYDLGFDGSFLAAPVCALGDWSIHDGTGVITYDHKVIDVGMLNQIVPYEARMDGPGGAAIWRGGTPPGAIGWVPVTVPLTEADWEMQSGTWSGLLASVTAFRIRIEQIDGDNDRDGLDNIVLPPPAPILATVSGSVLANCPVPVELLGVTVDLDHPNGNMFTTSTDANGNYQFQDLPQSASNAEISIVVPLGFEAYTPIGAEEWIVLDQDRVVNFSLLCLPATGEVRSKSYWKHEANHYLTGKGHSHGESEADMTTNFPDAMFNHFHENSLASIEVEGVTFMLDPGPVPLDLETILETLKKKGTEPKKAKQYYLATLLNMASGKLLSSTVVSEDGATASQAIQHVAALINDGDDSNDKDAKDICKKLNKGKLVKAGDIDLGLDNIAYARSARLDFWASPNPGRQQIIAFSLPSRSAVSLAVYDVAGRLIATPLKGVLEAGTHRVPWSGRNGQGLQLGGGLYFARLVTPAGTRSLKLVQIER